MKKLVILGLACLVLISSFAVAECVDSDGGYKPFEKGTIHYETVAGKQKYSDYCSVDEDGKEIIFETICNDESKGFYSFCPEGCFNGKCIVPESSCSNETCSINLLFEEDSGNVKYVSYFEEPLKINFQGKNYSINYFENGERDIYSFIEINGKKISFEDPGHFKRSVAYFGDIIILRKNFSHQTRFKSSSEINYSIPYKLNYSLEIKFVNCTGCFNKYFETCYEKESNISNNLFCSSEGEITGKFSKNAVCNSNVQCFERYGYKCLNNKCKKMNIFRKFWKFLGFYD